MPQGEHGKEADPEGEEGEQRDEAGDKPGAAIFKLEVAHNHFSKSKLRITFLRTVWLLKINNITIIIAVPYFMCDDNNDFFLHLA